MSRMRKVRTRWRQLCFARPLPLIDLGLQTDHDPKKKRPLPELEEGEVPPQRGTKQQKVQDPKDKRGKSIDSRDNDEVCRQQCI